MGVGGTAVKLGVGVECGVTWSGASLNKVYLHMAPWSELCCAMGAECLGHRSCCQDCMPLLQVLLVQCVASYLYDAAVGPSWLVQLVAAKSDDRWDFHKVSSAATCAHS